MKRVWTLSLQLEVAGEDRQIEFKWMAVDSNGEDKIIELILQRALEKGFHEINKAHRIVSVGEE